MGFFDELGSFLGEASSISDELKQSAEDAISNVTESTEQLNATKDELLGDIDPKGNAGE